MRGAEATRVLHVIEAMHGGGSERVVIEHACHAGAGLATVVCAINRGGPALEAARAAGADARVLDRDDRSRAMRRLTRVGTLTRLIRTLEITIVNAHNPTGALYGIPAAWRAGVPAVWTEHNIHWRGRHSWLYERVEPALASRVERVICVSDTVRDSHAGRFPRRASRYVTVRNGVDPPASSRARGETRAMLGLGEADVAILAVGSLTPNKAHEVLLGGFARLARREPRARLFIAGEGPRRSELDGLRHGLGIADRAALLGERPDVGDLLRAADVFAQSSLREGLPLSVLEAMSVGLPVLATASGGTAEAVLDGVTGRLLPMEDAEALAAGLRELCGSPELRARFGEAGRRRWSQEFSAARMVRDTEAIYHDALRARHARRRARTRGRFRGD